MMDRPYRLPFPYRTGFPGCEMMEFPAAFCILYILRIGGLLHSIYILYVVQESLHTTQLSTEMYEYLHTL